MHTARVVNHLITFVVVLQLVRKDSTDKELQDPFSDSSTAGRVTGSCLACGLIGSHTAFGSHVTQTGAIET